MENRNGLCVLLNVTQSVGTGCIEHEVASRQIDELSMRGLNPKTVGADRGYHNKTFVRECRERGIKPHVARIKGRKTPGLDGRTSRTKGYKLSQRIRKRCENIFGWMKVNGSMRKTRYRGVERTDFMAQIVAASCNLIRMAKLMEHSPPTQNAAAA